MRRSAIVWSLVQAGIGVGIVVLLAFGGARLAERGLELTVAYVALVIALQTYVLAHLLKTGMVLVGSASTSAVTGFSGTLCDSMNRLTEVVGHTSEISQLEGSLDGEQREHASRRVKALVRQLRSISEGIIPLHREEYYDSIIAEMDRMDSGGEVWAINYIDESRWRDEEGTGDPRQRRYLTANGEALTRGANIHRVFILTAPADGEEDLAAIRSQEQMGVRAKFFRRQETIGKDMKRDVVIFRTGDNCIAYEDFCDPGDPNRVLHGVKYVAREDVEEIEALCRKAFSMAHSV